MSILEKLPFLEYRGETHSGGFTTAFETRSHWLCMEGWGISPEHVKSESRCKMVTEVCPEVPWWMQCQAFTYELLKFMLLFRVYAELRIQGQKDWVGVLALHSSAQWTWKILTLSGLWGIICNLGTIFILWTAVVTVRWSPGSKSTLQVPWC